VQAREEMAHAMRFYDYLLSSGERPVMAGIAGPPVDWESAESVFRKVAGHEKKVTAFINALLSTAVSVKDTRTAKFLGWYVKEQEEEEESAGKILKELKKAGKDAKKIRAIGLKLGKRVFD